MAVRKAVAAESDYKMSDGGNLYLHVTSSGSKIWRINYRLFDKQGTYTIGPYPGVSLADAREERTRVKNLLNKGIDPTVHDQETAYEERLRQENTFKVVGEEYLASIAHLAEVTRSKKEWILRELVFPKLGRRPIAKIRPSEILEVLQEIANSGRLETARRTRQTIGKVFQLAALTDRCSVDPTHLLKRVIPAPQVTSHPAIVHESGFGKLLRDIEDMEESINKYALKFQSLTFQRPIELRMLTYDDFSFENAIWTIPKHIAKMRRPHDVPLSFDALSILAKVSKLTGMDSGFVFRSARTWKKPITENTMNLALEDLGYKGIHTSHGFRSSASTILHERGYRSAVIEFQLAHLEENETKRSYNRAQYWDERVNLMNEWAKICRELRK